MRFVKSLIPYMLSSDLNDEDVEERQLNLCVTLASGGFVDEGIDLARCLARENYRSSMLARLVPFVSPDRRGSTLVAALLELRKVDENRSRQDAIEDIAISAELLQRQDQMSLLSQVLRQEAERSRLDALDELHMFLPIARELAGDEILSELCATLETVFTW